MTQAILIVFAIFCGWASWRLYGMDPPLIYAAITVAVLGVIAVILAMFVKEENVTRR